MTKESTMDVLQKFYAAEAAYIAAGGRGKASFDGIAACLHPGVVMYQALSLPYGGMLAGVATGEVRDLSDTWAPQTLRVGATP
ncbi:hypothetical protein AB0H43_27095 [Hamadaea sp. NPDC050747]|uniref:hypothetical protein n=1 Tax=Hamadaea sp. NPDC050747 TaxID=3155789 RepID=UPI0033F789DB